MEDLKQVARGASCSWRKRAGAQHWLTTMGASVGLAVVWVRTQRPPCGFWGAVGRAAAAGKWILEEAGRKRERGCSVLFVVDRIWDWDPAWRAKVGVSERQVRCMAWPVQGHAGKGRVSTGEVSREG